jgi:hypothetical protein
LSSDGNAVDFKCTIPANRITTNTDKTAFFIGTPPFYGNLSNDIGDGKIVDFARSQKLQYVVYDPTLLTVKSNTHTTNPGVPGDLY